MDEVRTELADFFCEDRDSFKLEECFKLFLNFCQRFRTGILENEHRRQHEAAAENRRRQREEQLALKRRQSAGRISWKTMSLPCLIFQTKRSRLLPATTCTQPLLSFA